MTEKVYSFLGLATKAGRLQSGDDTCERAVKSGRALLVIVTEDASDNTKKKFSEMCKYRNVDIKFFGQKELLGRYVGKEVRSVAVILDQGFAKRLTEMLDGCQQKCGGE